MKGDEVCLIVAHQDDHYPQTKLSHYVPNHILNPIFEHKNSQLDTDVVDEFWLSEVVTYLCIVLSAPTMLERTSSKAMNLSSSHEDCVLSQQPTPTRASDKYKSNKTCATRVNL
eukprot:2609761-Amphidinium_carterae.2